MWLRHGAPAGVTQGFNLEGILEPVPNESPSDPAALSSEPSDFENYSSVETDPLALDIIDGYISQGWLSEFSSFEERGEFDESIFDIPDICKNKEASFNGKRLIERVSRGPARLLNAMIPHSMSLQMTTSHILDNQSQISKQRQSMLSLACCSLRS